MALATWPRPQPNPLSGAALTGRILEIVDARYVEKIDSEELLSIGINRMLGELDRNSAYFPPRQATEFQNEMNGTLFGIGIIMQMTEDGIRITHVLKDGPADQSGLPAKSRLISIDGENCEDWSLSKISSTIQGKQGTSVTLKVQILNEIVTCTPVRDEVFIPSLTESALYSTPENQSLVGLIRLQQFQPGSTDEVREALKALKAEELSGLIIDLRNNPGGVLEEAVRFCSLFLEKGKEIVSTRNRRKSEETDQRSSTQSSLGTGPWFNLPLVILIDGNSASASETVSAALRDHQRAVLVGEKSYGKWTVQGVFHLDSSETPALLKLTTDSFFPPRGNRLLYDDRGLPNGLVPDLETPISEEERYALYDAWSDRFYVRLADLQVSMDPSSRTEAVPLPNEISDPALEAAVKLLENGERYQQLLQEPPLSERSPR